MAPNFENERQELGGSRGPRDSNEQIRGKDHLVRVGPTVASLRHDFDADIAFDLGDDDFDQFRSRRIRSTPPLGRGFDRLSSSDTAWFQAPAPSLKAPKGDPLAPAEDPPAQAARRPSRHQGACQCLRLDPNAAAHRSTSGWDATVLTQARAAE